MKRNFTIRNAVNTTVSRMNTAHRTMSSINFVRTNVLTLFLLFCFWQTGMGQPTANAWLQLFGQNNVSFAFWHTQSYTQGARIGFDHTPNFRIINHQPSGELHFGTDNQIRMVMNPTGWLSLGNNMFTPLSRLHIYENSTADNYISMSNILTGINGGAKVGQPSGTNIFQIRQEENADMQFWVNNNSIAYMNLQGGNPFLGVNTASPLSAPVSPGYTIQNPTNPGGWIAGPGVITGNPYFTVQGGDIETDGDYYGGNIFLLSDARLKKDITEISTNWKRLLELKSYSYRFVKDGEKSSLSYGFIAQDVQKVFPELTSTWREGGSVNYIGFIPFLAQGLKEHEERFNSIETSNENIEILKVENRSLQIENQKLNEKMEVLENKLANLEQQLNNICNLPCIQNITPSNEMQDYTSAQDIFDELPILEQNEPNPFSETTVIRYYLPVDFVNAKIEVRNTENKLIGDYPILHHGYDNITISANTLAVGNYFYSLIVNGKIIDTKKMVLLN